MRLRRLILGDICFQFRHGFYYIYAILSILYLVILRQLPAEFRQPGQTLLIFTDPAVMGLFFMGAIILLEKAQHVRESLAVSPVKLTEYLLAKAVSLALIGTIAAFMILLFTDLSDGLVKLAAVFLGSLFFSLVGLSAAFYSDSLNEFLVKSAGLQILLIVPPILRLFGWQPFWFFWHPGTIIIRGIAGEAAALPGILFWFLFAYGITYIFVNKKILWR